MRVAIITETFLPQVNGVTNSVCRVVEHLTANGHTVLVIAPGEGPTEFAGTPVVRIPALPLPGNDDTIVGFATARRVARSLAAFRPDVIHLASPVWLGRAGMNAARRLGVPTVAVFQTDLAGFARGYRLWRTVGDDVIWAWLRHLHSQAHRTLAPSSPTIRTLVARGFPRVMHWGRGVDLERFHPSRRDDELRRRLAPNGERLVGYVGRLAPEKQVSRLADLRDLPGVRLVVVGDGPSAGSLRAQLPDAAFLGFQTGDELARTFASLDVFVHTGTAETFCQSVQEALASGVPVIAPAAGGPVDLVDHGRTGFLVPPGDTASLRVAVSAIAGDPEVHASMSVAARASVQGRTWAAVGDQLIGHYAAVVAAHAARSGIPA